MPGEAQDRDAVVVVIDDDESLRESLSSLFRSVGLDVLLFGSASRFLEQGCPERPSCIVLDVRLPGVSGLDFQDELARNHIHVPVVFVTGHGDIPMTVRAMKAGAVEFLTKPFREQDLLDAVSAALDMDRMQRRSDASCAAVTENYESLTPREKEVIGLVTAGLMNKQIAGELGVSEITIKVHRGNIMRKMAARSLVDLVRMADLLGIEKPDRDTL